MNILNLFLGKRQGEIYARILNNPMWWRIIYDQSFMGYKNLKIIGKKA